jgi:hypothetical protein
MLWRTETGIREIGTDTYKCIGGRLVCVAYDGKGT